MPLDSNRLRIFTLPAFAALVIVTVAHAQGGTRRRRTDVESRLRGDDFAAANPR